MLNSKAEKNFLIEIVSNISHLYYRMCCTGT